MPTNNTAPDLIGARNAADILGLDPETVKYHIRRGTLPARMIAGIWIIDAADLHLIVGLKSGPKPRTPRTPTGGATK